MLLRLALTRLPMQSVLRIPTTIASPISGMEWRIWQTFEHVHCTVQRRIAQENSVSEWMATRRMWRSVRCSRGKRLLWIRAIRELERRLHKAEEMEELMELTKDNQIDDSWSLMHGYDATPCSRAERKNTKLSQYHCLTSQNHSSTSWHYTVLKFWITQPESNIISLLTLIFGENNTRLSCESAARYG